MSRKSFLEKRILDAFLARLACFTLSTTGCKRNPNFSDSNIAILEQLSQNSSVSQDIRDRAQQAIANYTNSTIEPEPYLLYARILEDAPGPERNELDVAVLDEDKDLLGFGVKEELKDPDGNVHILEEEYPAFVHYQGLATVNVYTIPFFTRTNEQRKNEKIWADYVEMDFDTKMEQIKLPNSSRGWFADMEEYNIRLYELWEKSLPPIWISIPDPNKLTVWVYVYDKAGHKSNSVKLVKYTDLKETKRDN